MKKMKKRVVPILCCAAMLVSPLTAFANEGIDTDLTAESKTEIATEAVKEEIKYQSITGRIIAVHEAAVSDTGERLGSVSRLGQGEITIRMEYGESDDETGARAKADFIIDTNTYLPKGAKFAEGDEFTGFYLANQPMVMIYPARYTAVVATTINKEEVFPVVAVFDSKMKSVDNSLTIVSTEGTEIVDIDGKAYEGNLVGHTLYVEYTVSTMSLPPQTTPDKIVVIRENKQVEAEEIVEEEEIILPIDFSSLTYMIDNKEITADAPYETDAGVVMVPLRAIAEALGLEINWDGETASIRVGLDSTMKIGVDTYTFARMAPIELGQAPVLVEGKTYVPLKYFREVQKFNNAYIFENQIVINNDEKME